MKVYEMPEAAELHKRFDRMCMPLLKPYRADLVERFASRPVTGQAAFVSALTSVVQVMTERGECLVPQFQRAVAMVAVVTLVRDGDVIRDARAEMREVAAITAAFFAGRCCTTIDRVWGGGM